MRRHLLAALCIAIGTAAASAPVRAQAPSAGAETDARRLAARALAEKGYVLFEAGRYSEAYEHFRLAEEQYHAPTLLLLMARTQERLGKLVAARDLYLRVVAEPLAADAPPEFRDAATEATAALAALKKRIPILEVTLDGPARRDAVVKVDGGPVPIDELARGREADPGSHEVVLELGGAVHAHRTVVLREGRSQIRFPVPPSDVAASPDSRPARPGEPAARKDLPLLALVAFGVGALGLGVGTVTGLVSIGKVNELDSRCPNKRCLRSDEHIGNSAEVLGTVSTVGFVFAGLGAAAGTALLVLGPDLGLSRVARRRAGVALGPGTVAFEGAF